MIAAYRFELRKLVVTWRSRSLLVVCWSVPGVLVAAISQQGNLPTDTIFGRWMGTTGWAGSLVVLSFCCSWVLPLLASVLAGDVFAVEDRLGTWRHLLVAVRSTRRVFAAKALAALTVLVLLVAGLAASSTVGGVLAAGAGPLVGLDGQTLAPRDVVIRVLLSWLLALAPTLAFAGLGLLGSVVLGRSTTGLLLPALLALALQLLQLLPLPMAVRASVPSYAFLTWRGLFTEPLHGAAVLIGLAVCVAWLVAAAGLAAWLFQVRDFTDGTADGLGRRALTRAVLPLAALLAVSVAGVASATPSSGQGIDRHRLEPALARAFGHLYRLQARELHRPDVTEHDLHATAACDKGGSLVDDLGPGNDWRCAVTWRLPGVSATGTAVYQLQVAADGRYVADGDGPQSVNGSFPVATPTGVEPNPLWQLDGYVDLISHP